MRWIPLVVLLIGCGGMDQGRVIGTDGGGADGDRGSSCATVTLTYDNFGKQFIQSYCSGCHGDFGGVSEIRSIASELDSAAGKGTFMPPGSSPSGAERQDFSDWLECGAP